MFCDWSPRRSQPWQILTDRASVRAIRQGGRIPRTEGAAEAVQQSAFHLMDHSGRKILVAERRAVFSEAISDHRKRAPHKC